MNDFKKLLRGAAAGLAATVFSAFASAQTVTYFHNDVSGTPMLATNASGNVVWKENYRPYGDKINRHAASSSNRIGFHGKPHDDATGLSYMGARYYDPVLGRFMGIDPQGFDPRNIHSFNRYTYANNNPYKYVDPDGRAGALVLEVGIAVLATGAFAYSRMSPEEQQRAQQTALQVKQRANEVVDQIKAKFDQLIRNEAVDGNSDASQGADGANGKRTTSDGTSNPMEGEPGSCSSCNNSKGNKKQDRYYGSDGWPQTDIDYDHDHKDADGKKAGKPHAHDWSRPADGSRPAAENRGPARPLKPSEGK
jgi:RHS repeat-associated protein